MYRPYNTWNSVDIQYISQYLSSAYWDYLQGDGRVYIICQHSRANAGGRHLNNGACGGRGRGRGQQISETDTYWSDSGRQ